MTEPKREEFDVELGPLFAAGVVLAAYGILRRRAGAVLAGLGAIWLDQRSGLGRSLRERAKAKYLSGPSAAADSSADVRE
jgi:hypothetical protein